MVPLYASDVPISIPAKRTVNSATIQIPSNNKDTVLLSCFMLLEMILRPSIKRIKKGNPIKIKMQIVSIQYGMIESYTKLGRFIRSPPYPNNSKLPKEKTPKKIEIKIIAEKTTIII